MDNIPAVIWKDMAFGYRDAVPEAFLYKGTVDNHHDYILDDNLLLLSNEAAIVKIVELIRTPNMQSIDKFICFMNWYTDNTMHNIVIRLNNKNESPIKVGSNTYTFLMNVVRSICEDFDRVLEIKSNKNDNTTSDSSFSIADEIVKLKELYDQGILSEEEFVIGKEAILKRI